MIRHSYFTAQMLYSDGAKLIAQLIFMSETEPKKTDTKTIIIAAVIIAAAIVLSPIIRHYFPAAPASNSPLVENTGDARTKLTKPVDKTDHIRGNKNAKITLIEYADTECPYCMHVHETFKALLEKYPNDVNWVYRHLPFHEHADAEANISECIANISGNDAFWKYMDTLFTNENFSAARGSDVAKELGYWNADIEACVAAKTFDEKVQDDDANAAAIGAQGTPYTVIATKDGKMIPVPGAQPQSVFDSIIAALLKQH